MPSIMRSWNTLTMGTPFTCVPAAFQQWNQHSYAFPIEMNPAECAQQQQQQRRAIRNWIRHHFMATIDQSIDWTVLLIALEAMRSCCILSIGGGRHIKLITRLDRPHSPIHSARWWRRWRWCRWVACASTINQASIISLCSRATTPSTPLVRTTLPVNDGACHVVQCCNDRVSLFIYEFKWLTNWCICILAI